VRFAPLSPTEANGRGDSVPALPAEAPTTVSGESGERTTEAPRAPATRRSAAAPVAAQGVVALAVAPWGTVFVNGESRGTTPPLTELTLPAGRYLIEIRNGEQTPYVAQVDVTPDQPQRIRHRFQ
jgi:eukaryotic-like serine/threonine-protein kinase